MGEGVFFVLASQEDEESEDGLEVVEGIEEAGASYLNGPLHRLCLWLKRECTAVISAQSKREASEARTKQPRFCQAMRWKTFQVRHIL